MAGWLAAGGSVRDWRGGGRLPAPLPAPPPPAPPSHPTDPPFSTASLSRGAGAGAASADAVAGGAGTTVDGSTGDAGAGASDSIDTMISWGMVRGVGMGWCREAQGHAGRAGCTGVHGACVPRFSLPKPALPLRRRLARTCWPRRMEDSAWLATKPGFRPGMVVRASPCGRGGGVGGGGGGGAPVGRAAARHKNNGARPAPCRAAPNPSLPQNTFSPPYPSCRLPVLVGALAPGARHRGPRRGRRQGRQLARDRGARAGDLPGDGHVHKGEGLRMIGGGVVGGCTVIHAVARLVAPAPPPHSLQAPDPLRPLASDGQPLGKQGSRAVQAGAAAGSEAAGAWWWWRAGAWASARRIGTAEAAAPGPRTPGGGPGAGIQQKKAPSGPPGPRTPRPLT